MLSLAPFLFHMGGELFKFAAGLNVTHVPYKGTPEAL
jgi:hypothetical protein